MNILFRNFFLFCIIGLLLGECISRVFYVTSDIPSRVIDKNDIQKYKPDQNGSWVGGTHTWHINKDGWPGDLPDSYNNLITIIGDSYIENFMNPDSCRQSMVLKKLQPKYNFYEASRSGISFIEAMQIATHLDSLNPIKQLIYVHDSDFKESISEIRKMSDITQYNSKTNQITPGQIKSAGIKKILYNWKFIYYLYTNYYVGGRQKAKTSPTVKTKTSRSISKAELNEINKLLSYSNNKYNKKNITLVLRPNPNPEIIRLLKENNFNILILKEVDNRNWSFDHDAHWTCLGHWEAAKLVAKNIN